MVDERTRKLPLGPGLSSEPRFLKVLEAHDSKGGACYHEDTGRPRLVLQTPLSTKTRTHYEIKWHIFKIPLQNADKRIHRLDLIVGNISQASSA